MNDEDAVREALRRAAYAYDQDFWYFDLEEEPTYEKLHAEESLSRILAVVEAAKAVQSSLDDVGHDVFPVVEASLRTALANLDRRQAVRR
jgi:hypothetical protein